MEATTHTEPLTIMERHRATGRARAIFADALHALTAEPTSGNVVRYLIASRDLEPISRAARRGPRR